jgi:CubicO group peptidase (beta-lactamase class C family)
MRRVGQAALAVLVLLGLVYAGAWATTDRFGASRAIAWLESDTGDIDRFPAREVPTGSDPLPLPAGEPVDLAAIWPGDDLEADLAANETVALLIVRDGELVTEEYRGGVGPGDLRTSFSAVKSVVSTLVGLAISDGLIRSVDDPVTDYLPELAERDPRFADITIRHLLTMSSGLRYVERPLPWSDDAQTYYGTDLRGTALRARVDDEPGRAFLYNNYNLLIEGLVLERVTGMPVATYLSERLWTPMGAEADASWSLDSTRSGFEKMESGLNAVARDYARFGLLFAEGGRAGDRQVVPEDWVRQATDATAGGGPAPFYGFHWWTGTFDGEPFPGGAFMAAGKYGQLVYVAPDRDVVIVRLGDGYGGVDWPAALSQMADRL